MPHEVVLAPEAAEDLDELQAHIRAKVRAGLETHLRHEPSKTSRGRIRRLRKMTQPQYRLRIEDLRVFYDISGNTAEELAIVPESEAVTWLAKFGKAE